MTNGALGGIVHDVDTYGPNDTAVLKFLAQVARMTLDQARAMARLRAQIQPETLERAGWAMDRAAMMSGRTEALEGARDAIRVWRRFRTGVPWFGRAMRVYWRRPPKGHYETMAEATPALLDAIGALVVRDVLDAPTFSLLYGPWAAATAVRPATP